MSTDIQLWELPVFRNDGLSIPITAHERMGLLDEAKRRWDYIFRAAPSDIDQYFSDDYTEAIKQHASAFASWKACFKEEYEDAKRHYASVVASRDECFRKERAVATKHYELSINSRNKSIERFKKECVKIKDNYSVVVRTRDKYLTQLVVLLIALIILTMPLVIWLHPLFLVFFFICVPCVAYKCAPTVMLAQRDVLAAEENLKFIKDTIVVVKKEGIELYPGGKEDQALEHHAPSLTGTKYFVYKLAATVNQIFPNTNLIASVGTPPKDNLKILHEFVSEFHSLQGTVHNAEESLKVINDIIERLNSEGVIDTISKPNDVECSIAALIRAQIQVTDDKKKVEIIEQLGVAVNSNMSAESSLAQMINDSRTFTSSFRDAAKCLVDAEIKLCLVKEKIVFIKNQIPTDIPSDSEMKEFVDNALAGVESAAKVQLRLSTGEITVEKDIPPIVEWGKLQENRPGYSSFIPVGQKGLKRDTPLVTHLSAYRLTSDQTLIYAVYYAQYLFPTRDYIAVHGQFVDCIINETRGRLTDEYYYSDVTSVRTEMNEIDLFGKYMEATTFCLTVSSGDKVAVTFLDEALQESMRKKIAEDKSRRIKQLEELEKKLKDAPEEQKVNIRSEMEAVKAEHDKLMTVEKISVANRVVQDIRHQLRQKKTSSSA